MFSQRIASNPEKNRVGKEACPEKKFGRNKIRRRGVMKTCRN
jgi:hypothetical protein